MKPQILILTAAGFLLAASASHAAISENQRYAERANAKAAIMLKAAGVDPLAAPVSVRATVSADGDVTSVQVVRTSGSADTDRAVESVLRRILASDAPVGLINGAVTLNVSHDARGHIAGQ